LAGQRFNLVGDHGKALAGVPGPGRLDSGVEGQKVGLGDDVADQLHHLANLVGGYGQFFDRGVGLFGLMRRALGDFGRFVDLTADLSSRDAANSSAADATVCTLADACSAAAATALDCCDACSAVDDMLCAVFCISVEAAATMEVTSVTFLAIVT